MNASKRKGRHENMLISLLAAVLLTACAAVGHKIDQSQVEQIHKGDTTKADVLKMLGKPDQITNDGNGLESYQYMYAKVTPKGATFVPIVGLFAGGANVENEMVQVTFDSNGIVKNIFTTRGAIESSMYGGSPKRTIPPPVIQDPKTAVPPVYPH